MNIFDFLLKTRHIRQDFEHEERYSFYGDAKVSINSFCKAFSLSPDNIEFYPAYTSRASPEIIKIKSKWYIIWDYHFAELINTFNIITITNHAYESGDEYIRSNVSKESIQEHFLCCLFKYLSSQFFREPHISYAFGDISSQLSRPFSAPISAENSEKLNNLEKFQWLYLINHELSHIFFSGLSDVNKEINYIYLREVIKQKKSFPKIQGVSDEFYSSEDPLYYKQLEDFSNGMLNEFNELLAEEMVCDNISYKSTFKNWIESREINSKKDYLNAFQYTGAAINQVNNYSLLLLYIKLFWGKVVELYKSGEKITSELVEEVRESISNLVEEVFLRGSIGFDMSKFETLRNMYTTEEIVQYLYQSTTERRNNTGIEGFDNNLAEGWMNLKNYAGSCVSFTAVKTVLKIFDSSKEKLTPKQALHESQVFIDW